MNERIKELDTVAQDHASKIVGNDEDSNYAEWFNVYKEKFAELLIAECADTIDTWGDSGRFETFGQRLKAHFVPKQES